MSAISIPRSAFSPLLHLLRLSESDFEAMIQTLAKTSPRISRGQFCRDVADDATSDELSDAIESIVDELFNMESARLQFDASPEEMARDIKEAALEAKCSEFPIGIDDGDILQRRLQRLFGNAKSLDTSSKALEVLNDHDHLFYSARLFTDVRPVFGDTPDSISAAVIVHNLVIHYGEAGEHKDFHVSLDNSDIRALRIVLDRAEAKAKTLESLLSKAKVVYLNTEEN